MEIVTHCDVFPTRSFASWPLLISRCWFVSAQWTRSRSRT